MRFFLLLPCTFVLAMTAGRDCAAAARVGELTVTYGNAGVPCFSISEAEELRTGAPNFHSITVGEAGAKSSAWTMAMPRERTFPVSFRMCVPYAGRLPVLPQTPAASLQPGRLYEVTIETRAPFAPNAPRSYRARFCMQKSAPGGAVARDGKPEAKPAGKGRYACGA